MSTLEVPGYQPIHIERDAAGTWWLYMGSNFVALSRDQWLQFARMVADAGPDDEPAADDSGDPFGPEAYKSHAAGCQCWDCRAAREEAAGVATDDQCPGCIGRGTGETCCICGLPVPDALRRSPGDAPEYDQACPQCAIGAPHVHAEAV